MTKIYAILLLVCFGFYVNAQVTMVSNMPKSIAPNTEIVLEIKINKGAISNFAKYQIDVPSGVTVTEGDSKTGNFTFDANRAKIVWVSIPTEPEFVITMKLNSGSVSGPNVFNHKFYYLDNGVKKEVEGEALNVEFGGNSSAGNAFVAKETKTETKTEPVKETKTEPAATTTETKVVTNEPKTTSLTATPTETPVTTPTETKVAVTETKTEPAKETKTEPVKETKTEPEVKVTKTEAKTTSASGLVYKIQLGAYGADPGQAKFAAIGKVTMSNEGGFIKALYGSFSSKEEALKKREELIGKGFTGFVVAYQNGVRVK